MTTTSPSEGTPSAKRRAKSDRIEDIPSPALGCSHRTYLLVTGTAEIKGISRSELLDRIVERYFKEV
jgi:hypothetical protein